MSKAPNILRYEIIKGTAEFIIGAFLWIKNKSILHTNITAWYLASVANNTSREADTLLLASCALLPISYLLFSPKLL